MRWFSYHSTRTGTGCVVHGMKLKGYQVYYGFSCQGFVIRWNDLTEAASNSSSFWLLEKSQLHCHSFGLSCSHSWWYGMPSMWYAQYVVCPASIVVAITISRSDCRNHMLSCNYSTELATCTKLLIGRLKKT